MDARFNADIDALEVPDEILDPIFHYKAAIKTAVENAATDLMNAGEARNQFGAGLMNAICSLLGANVQIVSASVQNNELTVTFFTRRRRCVAHC